MPKLAVPTTAAELQEMMDDPKVAAQIIENGQWTEFTRAYAKATDERGEIRDLVIEAVKAGNSATQEMLSQADARVEETLNRLLSERGVNRPEMAQPALGTGAKENAAFNPLALGTKLDDLGFTNIGDFARVVNPLPGATPHPKAADALRISNEYSSVDPSLGGALVPETLRSEIMQIALEEGIIRPRATVQTMSSPIQSVPFVDHTTNVGSVFGGMIFLWTEEGGTIQGSEAKFGRAKLEANKLTGLGAIPNELWNDAPGLSSFVRQAAPKGIAFYEDAAFFRGTGAGQPKGVLNSEACVVVTKESGQPDETIVVENVLNMYSRMLPSSAGRAVWVANPTTFTQLMTLSIAVGTGGAPVALVNIANGPIPTMLGRPLILSEKVPVLGEQGDLGFYDFAYYLIGDRQAITLDASEHSRFASDMTELRIIERVDGRPWIQSPLQPLNGETLSPFVLLGERDT